MKLKTIILTLVCSVSLLAMETEEENTSISQHNLDVTCLDLSHDESLTDINFIRHFPNLKKLNLERCENLTDNYFQVRYLIYLTSLNLNQIYCENLISLSQLSNLKELQLAEAMIESIGPICDLPLKRLNIFGCNHIKDIHLIGRLSKLTHLNMSCVFLGENKDYPPLDFIENLTHLKSLDISYNSRLRECSILAHLPNLYKLKVGACDLIPNYQFLLSCHQLQKLYITDDKFSKIKKLGLSHEVKIIFQEGLSKKLP